MKEIRQNYITGSHSDSMIFQLIKAHSELIGSVKIRIVVIMIKLLCMIQSPSHHLVHVNVRNARIGNITVVKIVQTLLSKF